MSYEYEEDQTEASAESSDRILTLMPILLIVVLALAYFVFVSSSILPQFQIRSDVLDQLDAAEAELARAQQSQAETPDRLRAQVESAQNALKESAKIFLSDTQAADALSRLYEYASASGVGIVDLQSQTVAPENKEFYDVEVFRLKVAGPLLGLVDFVSRMEETTYQSYIIGNVNLAEGGELPTLTMDITLYTYALSSGAVPIATPSVPTPTPAGLSRLEEALDAVWLEEDWERAIILANQIRAFGPNDDATDKLYAARVNLGYQLLASGQAESALEQFNLALDVKPGGSEALAGIQQAIATPTPTLTAEQQLIRQLDEAWAVEDWNGVIRLLEQIAVTSPELVDVNGKLYAAHVNHGYQLAGQGRLDEAKGAFTRALAINLQGDEAAAGLFALATGTVPQTPAPQVDFVIYVVARGDTLYSIARRYGTTAQAIMDANGLSNTTIHSSLQLRIPEQR